jgi:ferritin
LDTEQEIERSVEEIIKGTGKSKLEALNMFFSKYESQRRLEEAARVRKIIDKEESKADEYGKGMSQDI